MALNLPLLFSNRPPELCADGIAIGPDALFVGVNDVPPDELATIAAEPRPVASGLTTLVPLRPDVVDWPRLQTYLGLYPAESLDKTVFHLPTSVFGPKSPAGLGDIADRLGVPVRYARAALTDDGAVLELGEHRIVYLDDVGEQVGPGTGTWVQIAPLTTRAVGAYEEIPDADVTLGDQHARQMIVLTPDGVQVGLAPTLVQRAFPQALRGTATAVEPVADPFTATGTTPVEVPGYSALQFGLRDLPPGGHALVGAGGVFLAVRDPRTGALGMIDVAAAAPALLPREAGPIRFATLPGAASVVERLSGLRDGVFGVRDGSFAAGSRDGLELFAWQAATGERMSIEVIGARDAVAPYLGKLAEIAEQLDQPMIVAGVQRPGGVLAGGIAAKLNERFEVYGFDRTVPLVVTLADLGRSGELLKVLTTRNAAVLYQAPGLSAGDGLFANLGESWAVREPAQPVPTKVADELSADLVRDGGGTRRAPAFEPPTWSVASFLTQRLTEPEVVRESFGRFGAGLDAVRAEVAQVDDRVPETFAGHKAMIGLAANRHLDSTLTYIADRTSPGAMIKPMVDATATGSPAEREAQLKEMLPHLADLAGHGLGDVVSQRIAQILSDMITGELERGKALESITPLAGQLSQDTAVRVEWVRALRALAAKVPTYDEIFTEVGTAIMKCP
ncbi:hypothetical protein GCM10023322_08390 [Rugosimonospora acidiphila]|uniref:Uncharacterized protein n=1 Tax=Rugosimonospora acidiphila TaxID=556531 RepID=A0ABP9RLW9_9ACTN